jgi:phage-related tail protein
MATPDEAPTIPGELMAIHDRLNKGEKRMDEMHNNLTANTEATQRIEKNTGEMLDFFGAMQGAFKLFNLVAKLAKPVGYIAAALAAIGSAVAVFKGGGGIGPK